MGWIVLQIILMFNKFGDVWPGAFIKAELWWLESLKVIDVKKRDELNTPFDGEV